MNKLKLSVLFIFAALSIASVGSAALSSVSFDRSASAGQILMDTDKNVAVQVSNISKYTNLVKAESDGKVSISLNEAINNNSANGFNTDAIFEIGSPTSGVVRIKNNSDIPITVTLNNDLNSTNSMSIIPANNSSATIGVGSSSDFYFTINTNGQDALKTLNAVIHVEGNQ
ncbi:MAG TPA: hypothetical protein VN258_17340 [Mobilitalea sp.]|nr:hypothetical protein [Mobilitalea sp.]